MQESLPYYRPKHRIKVKPVESLIVANLTSAEYQRFQRAHITYSGATGIDADPQRYNGYAPYIATYWDQLEKVIQVLRWKRFETFIVGPVHHRQYIIRRIHKSSATV